MEKELIEVFRKTKYKEEPNLSENIWSAIILRNKRIASFKLWSYSILGISSLIGLIPTVKTLYSEILQSGLYEYISLAFSNNGSALLYWKEILLSIADSLPTMSIALSFSLILILFLSFKNAIKQIIKVQLSPMGFSTLSF